MLRFSGALMICLCCIWAGFSAADRLRRRRDFLVRFGTSLAVLETEIEFGRRNLAAIFSGMDTDGLLYGFYSRCAGKVADMGIKRAWSEAADAVSGRAALTDGDREVIRSLGSELGMSDVMGQKRAIERTYELLSERAAEAGADCERLTRVYRGCGLLSGAFAVLMLM